MAQRKVKWGNLRMPEINEIKKKKNVVILPIGATEHHGRHLPVSFDTDSTVYYAEEAAKRVIAANPEVGMLVCPEIAYGDCVGKPAFNPPIPGSISITLDTLMALVYDVVDNLIHQGFRNILLLNGHYENEPGIMVALRKLEIKYADHDLGLFAARTWMFAVDRWMKVCKLGFGGLGHAGERETGVALNTQPDDVFIGAKYDQAGKRGPFPPKYSAPLCGEMVFFSSRVKGIRQDGIDIKDCGASTPEQAEVTKELGKQLMEWTISDVVEIINMILAAEGAPFKDIYTGITL